MMNKNERMNKLANAGVDTGKFFNINLPEGLAPGATISLVINENGQPVVVNGNNNDAVANQIIEDGYVRNTKLHRRFIMAQTFHMLNYKSHDGKYEGYTDYLNLMYGYDYTFKMMLEEVRVLSKLEVRDKESFEERRHFFTKEVVVDVLCDYVEKLQKYVDSLPTHKCKGVPYKKIKSMNVFVDDLNKKVYQPFRDKIAKVVIAWNYAKIYDALKDFMNDMIKLPYNTPKSKSWVEAFKGEGAYYTLKNLVMFHGCWIWESPYAMFDVHNQTNYKGVDAVKFIKGKLYEYQGEGYKMLALLKKVIKDNCFDFRERMYEIYNK